MATKNITKAEYNKTNITVTYDDNTSTKYSLPEKAGTLATSNGGTVHRYYLRIHIAKNGLSCCFTSLIVSTTQYVTTGEISSWSDFNNFLNATVGEANHQKENTAAGHRLPVKLVSNEPYSGTTVQRYLMSAIGITKKDSGGLSINFYENITDESYSADWDDATIRCYIHADQFNLF